MKLVQPSFEIIEQQPGLDGICKQIELAGRICYKSTDKITSDSAKGFVERMIKSGHGAMLEHGSVYLKFELKHDVPSAKHEHLYQLRNKYLINPFSKVEIAIDETNNIDTIYVSTNYRVLVENDWLEDLQYICEPTENHNKRVMVRFICDRGVSHEFVRHRVFSFAMESQRFCNYLKGKFDSQITFIIPCWIKDLEAGEYMAHAAYHHAQIDVAKQWYDVCMNAEFVYQDLIAGGWKPEEARSILPNSTKTELIMTGFVSDWEHFFDLRALGTTGKPHPQAAELAIPLYQEFQKRNLL